jgi:hypothetical protein
MAKAARRIWGHPYDSPNFHVAYGAMLQMGIYPHVFMGSPDQWDPWTSASLEEAVAEVKRRLAEAPSSTTSSCRTSSSRPHFRREMSGLEVRSARLLGEQWRNSEEWTMNPKEETN